jgi:hypothetical protein
MCINSELVLIVQYVLPVRPGTAYTIFLHIKNLLKMFVIGEEWFYFTILGMAVGIGLKCSSGPFFAQELFDKKKLKLKNSWH